MAQISVRNRNQGTGKAPNWQYRFEGAKIDGKRQQISKSGFKTKREALQAGAKALNEYNNAGMTYEPSQMSFADVIDYFYENHCKINYRQRTMQSYEMTYRLHVKPQLGHYKISAITSAVLQQYVNDLLLKGFNKRMIEEIASKIRQVINYAVEPMHLINYNPMIYVRMPRAKDTKKDIIILDSKDWNTIIERFPQGSRFHLPLMIGYYTGLRIGEVFALTWDNIDFENRTLTVEKQILKRNYGKSSCWVFSPPKTKTSTRTIKFGDTLYNLLKSEYQKQKQNELTYGNLYTVYHLTTILDEKNKEIPQLVESQKSLTTELHRIYPVCIEENGSLTTTESFKYCSRVIHYELGITFNFHALRHTHATRLIEQGASIKSVQTRLGHNNVMTTMQTYVHDTESMENEAVEIFEKFASSN